MKSKLNVFICMFIILLAFTVQPSKSQTLELNTTQTFTVSGPGFFPFTPTANTEVQGFFSTDPNLNVQFSNFLGSPCLVAPAADFSEIGPQTLITGNKTVLFDFSGAMQNANTFGLSFVPQNGTCLFDVFISPPLPGTTSSSSGEIISGPGETFPPNGITVIGGFLDSSIADQLSNEPNNPQCQSDPSGINPAGLSNETFFTMVLDNFFKNGTETSLQRADGNSNLKELAIKSDPNSFQAFSLLLDDKKSKSKGVYDIKLSNTSDTTKIFATAIFPSITEDNTVMLGAGRINPEIEVTLKEQDLAALAAVQHAIVSATMPWQLSNNGGYFITQGGGCVGPYCTIVESGMVVIVPGGACTPDKLNKRRAGYPTVNPSKLFDPFPAASSVIQIPSSSIVAPTHPLVSKIVRDNAYLIFQPVPPKAKITQQLKINLTKGNNP